MLCRTAQAPYSVCKPELFTKTLPACPDRVTLHLKEDAAELADPVRLARLIKQYSQFISFPIKLYSMKKEPIKVGLGWGGGNGRVGSKTKLKQECPNERVKYGEEGQRAHITMKKKTF